MKQFVLTVLFCSCIIILFDISASTVSEYFLLNYSYFALGSFLIYAYTGFYCVKHGGLLSAALGSAFVGLVESTIGWYLSNLILKNYYPSNLSFEAIVSIVISVVLSAAFFGLIGGLIGRRLSR